MVFRKLRQSSIIQINHTVTLKNSNLQLTTTH